MILNKILLNLFANPLLSLAITNTERKVNLEDACGVRLSRSCPQIQKFIVGIKTNFKFAKSPMKKPTFRRSLELCGKGPLECFDREEGHEAAEAEAECGPHLCLVWRQPRHPEPCGHCGPLCLGKQVQRAGPDLQFIGSSLGIAS